MSELIADIVAQIIQHLDLPTIISFLRTCLTYYYTSDTQLLASINFVIEKQAKLDIIQWNDSADGNPLKFKELRYDLTFYTEPTSFLQDEIASLCHKKRKILESDLEKSGITLLDVQRLNELSIFITNSQRTEKLVGFHDYTLCGITGLLHVYEDRWWYITFTIDKKYLTPFHFPVNGGLPFLYLDKIADIHDYRNFLSLHRLQQMAYRLCLDLQLNPQDNL